MKAFERAAYGFGIAFLVIAVIAPEAVIGPTLWMAILLILLGSYSW